MWRWGLKFGVLACCCALYYTSHPTLALAVALIAFGFAVDAAFAHGRDVPKP